MDMSTTLKNPVYFVFFAIQKLIRDPERYFLIGRKKEKFVENKFRPPSRMGDLALDAGPAAPAARPRRALDRHAHGNEAGPALRSILGKQSSSFFTNAQSSLNIIYNRFL